jgi:hypothetical protein
MNFAWVRGCRKSIFKYLYYLFKDPFETAPGYLCHELRRVGRGTEKEVIDRGKYLNIG